MTKEEAIQDQMDEIMDNFEFHKAQQIMEALDWKWNFVGEGERIPHTSDIRRAARRLLKYVAENGGSTGTGGLTAFYKSGYDEDDAKPWVQLGLHFGLDTFHDGTCYDP